MVGLDTVKVVSFNCRGFPKLSSKLWTKPTVNLLLQDDTIDIICLQETFLSRQDSSCLNVIHKDFQGVGTYTIDNSDKLVTGHPPGGVAILYRSKHVKCISPLHFNLDWVIGISVNDGIKKHVILCVYMKTASGGQEDHKEIFQGQLEELNSIINDLDTTSVTIIGDWNADLSNPSHPHGPLLRQFSSDTGVIISSDLILPVDTFTYISEMRPGETSWLNHCVSTQDGHNIIDNLYVDYQKSCRDHIPIVMELGLDKLPEMEEEVNDVAPRLNWDSYEPTKLREYSMMSDINLSRLSIPREALVCMNTKCDHKQHSIQINKLYEDIVKCLIDASNDTFETKNKKPYKCRPGFNDHVKELCDIARKCFVA